jgi:hypothetical protein
LLSPLFSEARADSVKGHSASRAARIENLADISKRWFFERATFETTACRRFALGAPSVLTRSANTFVQFAQKDLTATINTKYREECVFFQH